jgi:thiol-disulfide isomerase/thioredoxin
MSAVQSKMVPLGTKAPNFNLPDVISGRNVSLEEIKSDKATVIMFICNHCPYVINIYDHLAKLSSEYIKKGIAFVGINSNNYIAYPDDAPDKMKEVAERLGYEFPYLIDETQEVAKAYQAECTPDFFVYDKDLKLIYRGQYDDSRPGNGIPVTGKDLKAALDAVIEGREVPKEQIPSIGCNIKWK